VIGTWGFWTVIAAALAIGGAAPGSWRAALLVALAGAAMVGPGGRRIVVVLAFAAVTAGAARAAAIDRAAAPLAPRMLSAQQLRMVETLPAHGPARESGGEARAVWRDRAVIVGASRFGRPGPALRRGWIVRVSGRLSPLGASPADRRLARQGIAGRVRIAEAVDTGRRRGGPFGAIDGVARDASVAATAAGGPRAGPLLAGMALGTAEEIAPEDRDALRAAGLWHLAAASGGNIALVVALCFVVGWCMGVPDRARIVAAMVAVVAYVPLAGAGPSIQRAGVMGIAALAALLVGRRERTVDALGLAAAATLALDPRAWLDVGWQLSFAATAALLFGAAPATARLGSAGLPRVVALPLATTALATLATIPIMLTTFGTVSASGLLTNVAAAPIAAVTVWSGAIAAAVAPVSGAVARLVAEPGAAGAHATLVLADWGAGRAHAQLGASGVAIALCGAAVLAFARPGRQLVALLGAGLIVFIAFDAPQPPKEPRVVVFDIGQGSAALLQAGADAVLVDAGPVDGRVVAQLRRAGVRRLRALILSHPAADHDGGGAAVLRAFPTDLVLDGGMPGGGPTHAAALREAARRHVRVVPVRAGQRVAVGGIDLRIRWPTPAAARRPGDPNERAAVVDARIGTLRALIPADAESNVLRRLAGLRADVLVVSHHGSADSDLAAVLRQLRPAMAVISVGMPNTYGHPTPSTLATLRRAHVPTLRTDQGGSVDVRRDGATLSVRRIDGRAAP
jgi:competence protein ComEC